MKNPNQKLTVIEDILDTTVLEQKSPLEDAIAEFLGLPKEGFSLNGNQGPTPKVSGRGSGTPLDLVLLQNGNSGSATDRQHFDKLQNRRLQGLQDASSRLTNKLTANQKSSVNSSKLESRDNSPGGNALGKPHYAQEHSPRHLRLASAERTAGQDMSTVNRRNSRESRHSNRASFPPKKNSENSVNTFGTSAENSPTDQNNNRISQQFAGNVPQIKNFPGGTGANTVDQSFSERRSRSARGDSVNHTGSLKSRANTSVGRGEIRSSSV